MKEPADKIIELIQEHSVHVFAEIGVGKFKTGKAILTHPVASKLIIYPDDHIWMTYI